MSFRDYLELFIFTMAILITAKPLGLYLNLIFNEKQYPLGKAIGQGEKVIYQLVGINPQEEQDWIKYAKNILSISFVSLIITYIILRLQQYLPLNPQKLAAVSADLAWNTSMSFTTNTNWQSYTGESTLSYLSQMVGLTLHNFFSAAVGICVAVAVIRGIANRNTKNLGNFWVDLVRCNLYLLLPICFIYALFLVSQGVVQTFAPYLEFNTLEGIKQVIPFGPVASQIAIKMLGTNGGGFFNANAAHPFENPTALSNFVQMFSIFLIPSALVYLLGIKTKNIKHAYAVWAAMAIVFIGGVLFAAHFEYQGNPTFTKLGTATAINMEGKETRFGIFDSSFFATVTTDASCGAVNSMHDSFTPLGGLVPLFNIQLGELIFGGVGSGLYMMVLFIILTVFISGLMVGRTPEYMGKKIEGREVKYAMFTLIVGTFSILFFAAWASISPLGLVGLANNGPHGLSEMLYAFSSATGNNGSAFAGLSANTVFWNLTLGIAMFAGRFMMMIPLLALAGSLSDKKIHPESESTFPVHGLLFTFLLIGIIIIVGALTYFPALSLGPIAEHFEMLKGTLF